LITGTPNGNTYINPSPLDNGRGLYMYYRWEFQLSRGEGFIYVLPLGVPVIKRRGVYICITVETTLLLITGTPNGNTYINPSPLDNWNSQR
jgi:hypothetical protein